MRYLLWTRSWEKGPDHGQLTERVAGPDEDDIVQPDGSKECIIGTPSDAGHICERAHRQLGSWKLQHAAKLTRLVTDEATSGLPVFDVGRFRPPDFTSAAAAGGGGLESARIRVTPRREHEGTHPSWAQMTTTRSSDPEARYEPALFQRTDMTTPAGVQGQLHRGARVTERNAPV